MFSFTVLSWVLVTFFQELLLQEMSQAGHPVISTSLPPAKPGDLPSMSAIGVDPFLSQGGTTIESHARQNSGDSGLGESRGRDYRHK